MKALPPTLRLAILSLAAMLLTVSCGSRSPASYAPGLADQGTVHTLHVTTLVVTEPQVDLHKRPRSSGAGPTPFHWFLSGVRSVGQAAGMVVEKNLEERVAVLAPRDHVQERLTGALEGDIPQRMSIAPVGDAQEEHELRLVVEVRAYGIQARDISSPAYYFLDARTRLIHVAEDRVIWKAKTASRQRAVSRGDVPGSVARTVTGTKNVLELASLEDSELEDALNSLVLEAAISIAERLQRDSNR